MSIIPLSDEYLNILENDKKRSKALETEFPWDGPPRQIIFSEAAFEQLDRSAYEAPWITKARALNEGGSTGARPFVEEFKASYPDLWKELTDNIWPHGQEPVFVLFKYWPSGIAMSLHEDFGIEWEAQSLMFSRRDWRDFYGPTLDKNEDKFPIKRGMHGIWTTTSIIAKKSEDLKGGMIVLSDDYDLTREHIVRQRLRVYDNTEVGWGMSWSEFTKHGVSKIEQGERITILIAKKAEDFDSTMWGKTPVSKERLLEMIDEAYAEVPKEYKKWYEERFGNAV